jgi:hypothetical protein
MESSQYCLWGTGRGSSIVFLHHRLRGAGSTIEFIDSSYELSGTSVDIPTHAAGDLILVFYIQNAIIANETAPAGWTTIFSKNEGLFYKSIIAYKIASDSSTTSGSWANGNFAVFVWRGVNSSNPIGNENSIFRNETAGTLSIPSLTTNSSGWIASFAMLFNANKFSTGGYPSDFSNMKVRFNNSNFRRAWDSNGVRSSLSTQNFSLGGTFYFVSSSIELIPK